MLKLKLSPGDALTDRKDGHNQSALIAERFGWNNTKAAAFYY